MEMLIKVKGVNDQLVFMMDEHAKFHKLMDELESLLEKPMFQNSGYFPKAFFDFKGRFISDFEIKELLHILFKKQVVVFDGIAPIQPPSSSKMLVIQRTIHAGEHLILDQDALITGHINPGGIVTFTNKLYVLGKVSGMVEGLNSYSSVNGQCFDHAHVRINGTSRHDVTSFELSVLYYRDSKIYLDKGEIMYG